MLDSEQKSIIWNDILSGRAEMSHFYWRPNKGDSITLEISTNCEEVELLQNGKSLGVKYNDRKDNKVRNKLLWRDISWQPGNVIAIARNNGKEVARHELQSPGQVMRLKVEVENMKNWKADGMDLQYVRFIAVDNNGRAVENFEGELSLSISGEAKLIALDNGDHFTNENFERTSTTLYRGEALAILRSTRKGGVVTIKATCNGLKTVSITMTTHP